MYPKTEGMVQGMTFEWLAMALLVGLAHLCCSDTFVLPRIYLKQILFLLNGIGN